jgi:biopolymer transport protein ExbD
MAIDKYGRRINPNYQSRPVSSFVPSYHASVRRRNIWERANNFISDIGEWIEDNRDALSNNLSVGFYFLAWIGLVIGVISQWINSSFWSALLTFIIGGVIVFYAAAIGTGILMYALRVFFFVARYIFYNIYTLLIAIVIVVAIIFSNQINIPAMSQTSPSTHTQTSPSTHPQNNSTPANATSKSTNTTYADDLHRANAAFQRGIKDGKNAHFEEAYRLYLKSNKNAGYKKFKARAEEFQANGLDDEYRFFMNYANKLK